MLFVCYLCVFARKGVLYTLAVQNACNTLVANSLLSLVLDTDISLLALKSSFAQCSFTHVRHEVRLANLLNLSI